MKWDFVGVTNLMWQVLEKVKKFLLASAFSLYNRTKPPLQIILNNWKHII
jgi:hypothetical protein